MVFEATLSRAWARAHEANGKDRHPSARATRARNYAPSSANKIARETVTLRTEPGAGRVVPSDHAARWLRAWRRYRERIVAAGADAERPFLLDCHSFPADLAPDVDVCLGWNEDESRPTDDVLCICRASFETHGFRVAYNKPYGNAILPVGWRGPSMLVEFTESSHALRSPP